MRECDTCGKREVSYNSCRNRHCPKCGGAARAAWLEAQRGELLPVPYFHLVFTLPHQLAPLALLNPRVVCGLLFRAASRTLQEVAANPRHLGAQLGGLLVLHTWGQNLEHHPHVHCIVPGGGLSADRKTWVASGEKFFLPVKVLSRVFRGKFMAGLRQAWQRGQLVFTGRWKSLAKNSDWERLCKQAVSQEWVVHAKPPHGGAEQTLKYLARYTHRVALSNERLLHLHDGRVTFSWKNYAAGGKRERMTLCAVEFLRRFLLHVLPKGLVRVRHFGLWANRHRQKNLNLCRQLLGMTGAADEASAKAAVQIPPENLSDDEPVRCPHCRQGRWILVEQTPRPPAWQWRRLIALFDSS